GQPGLKRRLGHKTYRALRQRIGLFYYLGPLSEAETLEYVNFRLLVGGRENSLFTDEALSLVHKYSEGIPRLINSIATTALLEGLGKELDNVGAELIDDAAKELMLN
ncbi:MAG: hypothetical protein KAJ34_07945, partial [Thermodesulfovibrionia bacterium]|nr:hypothetical protein [Thermodesulfovibrionia bacterium]